MEDASISCFPINDVQESHPVPLIFTELRCKNITNLREKLWIDETWEDGAKVELIMQCMKHDINIAELSYGGKIIIINI